MEECKEGLATYRRYSITEIMKTMPIAESESFATRAVWPRCSFMVAARH